MSNEAINWAYSQKIDNPLRKFVLVTLADGADRSGYLFKHYSTIAEMCDMSRRTVIRHVNQLVIDGFLIKETRSDNGFYTSNIYRLNMGKQIPVDHPLKDFCQREFGGDNLSPGGDNLSPGGDNLSPGGDNLSPGGDTVSLIKEPLLNPTLTERERDALSRDGFFREMDKGFKADDFKEFSHLTESEIAVQAALCWDHWEANGKWPGGNPTAILRNWIRTGIEKGKVRKATVKTASHGEQLAKPEQPLQPWQERIRPMVGEAVLRAWFLKMELQGNSLVAPSKFIADYVQQHHGAEIAAACGNVVVTHLKEKELCTA